MSYAIGVGVHAWAVRAGWLFPGSNLAIAYAVSGVPIILVAACYTLLAIAMPRSGGSYIFISRIISPTWGFLASWVSWTLGGFLCLGLIAYYDGYFWGLALFTVGTAFKMNGLVNAGLWLMRPFSAFLVGALLLVICFILNCFRVGIVVRVVQALWIIPVIASGLMIGTLAMNWGLAAAKPEVFKAKWDAVMGQGSYDEVMNIALAHGFDVEKYTKLNWQSTWAAAAFASAAAYGSPATPTTAVAGEVKIPTKTQLIGTLVGVVLIAAYYITISGVVYAACDPFVRAYTFNYFEGYSKEYTITPNAYPTIQLFAGILSGNPGLAIYYSIAIAVWLWNDLPPWWLYLTRFVFSWAFDRSFPSVFAQVHPTLRSPINANVLILILGLISCAMFMGWWLYGIFVFLDQITVVGMLFPDFLVGLSTAHFPLSKPEIFKASPVSAWTIGGIPIAYIIGILGFGSAFPLLILAFSLLAPGGALTVDLVFTTVVMAIGIIIATVMHNKAYSKGIPVHEIYSTLPPA